MFGNKRAKQERLNDELALICKHGEIKRGRLAYMLNVSLDTVENDLVTLDRRGVKLCEHKGRISLIERWYGKRR